MTGNTICLLLPAQMTCGCPGTGVALSQALAYMLHIDCLKRTCQQQRQGRAVNLTHPGAILQTADDQDETLQTQNRSVVTKNEFIRMQSLY